MSEQTPEAEAAQPTGAEPASGGDSEAAAPAASDSATPAGNAGAGGSGAAKRRRGSRGGKNRNRPRPAGDDATAGDDGGGGGGGGDDRNPELPDRHIEGRPSSVEAAERSLVRRPEVGDVRAAPLVPATPPPRGPAAKGGAADGGAGADTAKGGQGRSKGQGNGQKQGSGPSKGEGRSKGQGQGGGGGGRGGGGQRSEGQGQGQGEGGAKKRRRRGGRRRGGGGGGGGGQPVRSVIDDGPLELDEEVLAERRGRSRKGKPVGRYLMAVSVGPRATQIAVLEGRHLIEHYVSEPADDIMQIHGNIYIGRVENVLPGMEAAFVDIGTPKNAVLYRGDVQYDAEDIVSGGKPKIEEMLSARQSIICQVTKNPIAHKGARLTQEVSLPGRFVVLVPNSSTYGISKRLPDAERKRLRKVLDRVRPDGHGVIVRTAAENITAEEIERDLARLERQWDQIAALAKTSPTPSLLYREPELAVRIIREEFSKDFRGIVIDDKALFDDVQGYLAAVAPALVERVQLYDTDDNDLPLFERHHVHEQIHKAVDRKVWLPSGGSLIIEHTEALTVIDVNTGKNVGRNSLEETVFQNNLEAAEEIARQLRLRDIGGIIVIDYVDMDVKKHRDETIKVFRRALARDKTRTQVFDISDLGLVEMTRKRIGEGLLESLSNRCPTCEGRGLLMDGELLPQ